jgi:hypothetical protein
MADTISQHQEIPSTVPSKDMNKTSFDQLELVEDASVHNSVPGKQSRAPELVRNMTPEIREKLENSLRKKIDLRLLPMIVLMYILNYLDRNNIAAARLAGLEKDLKMHGNQFQVRKFSFCGLLIISECLQDVCQHFVCGLLVDARYVSILIINNRVDPRR